MFNVTDVAGHPAGTSYLVTTEKSAFLVDTGLSFCAERTAARIRAALDGTGTGGSGSAPALRGSGRLDYILLTHSHFDHAAGTPIISCAFPDAPVVASAHAARVFERPGARAMIRELDAAAARDAAHDAHGNPSVIPGPDPGSTFEDTTPELRVDLIVQGGDTIGTADQVVRVYATPGHTNCSVSYHFENESLLATSESSGFIFGDIPWPSFMTSYRDSLAAIDLVERLAPQHLLLPHAGLLSGDAARAYPKVIRRETEEKADFILSRHRAGMTDDEIIRDFVTTYFDGLIACTGLQTRESFTANAEEVVPRLIAESEGARTA
jgi:glyoxylase-like metal-dependent hydrolase (beta-lactamase superfamily II)